MINYHYYANSTDIAEYLAKHKEEIQCIVGENHKIFGSTQEPKIDEYADNINTMDWLHNL